MLLEEVEEQEPEWRTGTAIDEFNGLYRVMAVPTKTRPGFSPAEVDRMLVSTCAVLLGAGVDETAKMNQELEQLARRREAGEDVNWFDLD